MAPGGLCAGAGDGRACARRGRAEHRESGLGADRSRICRILRRASAKQLEMQGDILRARRFPADALDYYHYALARGGGDASVLMNKMGVTELELGNIVLARALCAERVEGPAEECAGVEQSGRDRLSAEALSAMRFATISMRSSATDSRRCITPTWGWRTWTRRTIESARAQLIEALKLDPEIFAQPQ